MRVLRCEDGRVECGGRELVRPGAPLWIDLAPTPEGLAFLRETFGFHPLALEDCAHEGQRSKLEQYPGNIFAVVHRIAPAADESSVNAYELHTFLTAAALVTVHNVPIGEIDGIFERCLEDPSLLGRGPDFALYLVHDALTDAHYAVVDALTSEIEDLSEAVTAPGGPPQGEDVLGALVAARRSHAAVRRRLGPQREVFAALARPGQALVREATAIYFRDVVDHAVRLTEEVDTGRELLATTMDTYLTHVNNRMSTVTARLTLVATVFLPLNFVAGFFGMNLEILPPSIAIPLVLAAMIVFPIAMWTFFRRKRWL